MLEQILYVEVNKYNYRSHLVKRSGYFFFGVFPQIGKIYNLLESETQNLEKYYLFYRIL